MKAGLQPTPLIEQNAIEESVKRLLDEAKAAIEERGDAIRTPFFGPINITIVEKSQQWQFSGFSRELSSSGIGMLHSMPLEAGEVVLVTISRRSAPDIRLRSKLRWCEPCGEGWYISGAEFLDVC